MSASPQAAYFPLFVPATRPERIAKAAASGASAVIVDLEDAVAPADKPAARVALSRIDFAKSVPIFVRINGEGTPWHEDDVDLVAALSIDGIVLPKAENIAVARKLRDRLPAKAQLHALIESARGLAAVRELAPAFDRLLFGSLDFAADMGIDPVAPALAHARAEIALAARLAEHPGPIDGVTPSVTDLALIEREARDGGALGFRGKMLIHPAQLAPARAAYSPAPHMLDWARRVLDASQAGAIGTVDGAMIDAPIISRARRILADAQVQEMNV